MSFPAPSLLLRRGRAASGFTLIEMVITLAVFLLLSSAIFGIITGVLQSATSLEGNQNRADESMALQAYLKRKLSNLPGGSLLISYRRGDGEGLDQNGIIFGTPHFLTAIDAKVQANGLYTLRVTNYSTGGDASGAPTLFQNAVASDDSSLVWRSLIRDVQHMDWKFQDSASAQWVDHWDNPTTKPNLTELSVQIGGDLQRTTMDFWIPPIFSEPTASPPL